jgi:REP element-mobilizing transposase RayT
MLRVRDMPDHVHILIRKHKHQAEEMMDRLREAGRLRLYATGHRYEGHPTWTAGSGWKVYLDHPDEVRRTLQTLMEAWILDGTGKLIAGQE